MMDYAKRVEELMNKREWSIYRLFVKSGVSQHTIKDLPKHKDIQLSTLEKLCNAFEISLSDFFKDDKSETMEVTPKQKELLTKWSALMPSDQDAIYQLIKTIIESQK